MMSQPTDFSLSPKSKLKIQLAKAFAFSRATNRRNLEAPWYALWDGFLKDLIEDKPHLLVNPQFTLYYKGVDADGADADDADAVMLIQVMPVQKMWKQAIRTQMMQAQVIGTQMVQIRRSTQS